MITDTSLPEYMYSVSIPSSSSSFISTYFILYFMMCVLGVLGIDVWVPKTFHLLVGGVSCVLHGQH